MKLSDWTPEQRERLTLWLATQDKLRERTTPEIVNMLLEYLPMSGAYGALVEEACTRLQPDWMDEKYDTTPPAERPDAGPVALTAEMAHWILLEGSWERGEQEAALRAIREGQTVCAPAGDAAIGEVVWRFIDRMKDVSPPEDSAERILSEFVAAVQPAIDSAIARTPRLKQ